MTLEQIGLYVKMLCLQHQHNGRIPTAELRTQCDGIANGDAVYRKFKHDGAGSYNERLQIEMEKRKQKGIKARESANKRWNKEPFKHLCESNANAMRSENANENENINEINKEGGVGGDFNWESVKTYFLNADPWMYKFCSLKAVSRETLVLRMNEFLNDIELRNEYKPLKDLQSHFTNWFNKSEKQKKNAKPNKNSGRDELLESLRQKHAGNNLG